MRLPPCVMNGATVFPDQSYAARNVATGGATVPHQQGEPTKNHVVCADVGQAPLQRGPVSPADLALGLGHNGIVLRRVGALRDDLEKIPVRSLGNLPRHFARVAAM